MSNTRDSCLNNFEGLLGEPGPGRHAEFHGVKFSLLETAWSPRYDYFWISCWPPYFFNMGVHDGIWRYMGVYEGMLHHGNCRAIYIAIYSIFALL